MAFASGHNPPSGFSAGQLVDGAVFGTFTVGSFGIPPQQNVSIQVILRYYRGMLIGMTKAGNNSAIDNVEGQRVKSREYFNNLKSYPGFSGVSAFSNLIPMLATAAQLQSVGISENALTLDQATGTKMPYSQDADGNVTPYVDPQAAQTAANNALIALANNATGNKLTTDGTTTASTTPANSVDWKKVLLYLAIGAVVVVGGIMLSKSLKGKNKGKGSPYHSQSGK